MNLGHLTEPLDVCLACRRAPNLERVEDFLICDGPTYFVRCYRCGISSLEFESADQAGLDWNERLGEKATR